MTFQSSPQVLPGGDQSARSERVIAEPGHDGNPLMSEYRQLYEEYRALKHRYQLLELDKSRLHTQLAEMDRSLDLATRIDPMTGLANRRDIMEKMERELSRSERHARTFSIMLIDLDNFRQLNEKYGYNYGDDVLVEVARVLMGCVRSEDVCARWGGEEFLFLLPETDLDGSLTLARKVLDSISLTEFKANRPGIHITASIGVCGYQSGRTSHECLSLAHQALRLAKQGGKGRVEVAV